jgi:serine-type D-Ala-D-Ala carboxypeptidase
VGSIFPVSSITKPITATAAMILVEDGLLGLNRPVRDYLPEICGKGSEEIMVHHLLTHTSGYSDEEIFPLADQKFKEGFDPGPCEETQHPAVHRLLAGCYAAPLSKPPGTEMEYCNVNYELVGEIIRRLTGRSLADFAQERIFGPLGMKDSYYVVPDAARLRVVKRPPEAPFVQPLMSWFHGINSREREETPWAFGGVYSSAKDLAIFGQMFLNGGTYGQARILSRPAVAAMTRNQIPGIASRILTLHREASYGYGWIVESSEK